MASSDKIDQVVNEADKLYDETAKASVDEEGRRSKIFFQDDLQGFIDTDDSKALMPLIQYLSNRGLFRTLKVGGRLGWSVRPKDAARQIVSLERDEKMIYEVVEEAHVGGVWSRDIRKKTNLPQNTMSKALGKMEKSGLIKTVKAVKNPAQRTYMLTHLQPSEEVTGNSFYDAGELDESFRDELLNLIVFWVRQQSWAEPSRRRPHKRELSSPTLVANDLDSAFKKRKRTDDIEDITQPNKHRSLKFDPETDFVQLVYKAGSHSYPCADDVLSWIKSSGVVKPLKATTLTVQEIQGCLDVLCWDDQLEKMPNKDSLVSGYRTVRGVSFKAANAGDDFKDYQGTGLTQAPCGRCPVFDLCHEGGPVNPQECVYFEKWLD